MIQQFLVWPFPILQFFYLFYVSSVSFVKFYTSGKLVYRCTLKLKCWKVSPASVINCKSKGTMYTSLVTTYSCCTSYQTYIRLRTYVHPVNSCWRLRPPDLGEWPLARVRNSHRGPTPGPLRLQGPALDIWQGIVIKVNFTARQLLVKWYKQYLRKGKDKAISVSNIVIWSVVIEMERDLTRTQWHYHHILYNLMTKAQL